MSARDRPGARLASERVIWWNQELRILNGIVYGFFEEEDEPEGAEARSFRYRNSSLEEVSDPEEWRGYHHFDDSPTDSENGTPEEPRGQFNIWGNVGGQGEQHGREASHSEPDGEPDEYHDLRVARESALRLAMARHLDALDRGDVEDEIFYENQVTYLNCL